MVKISKLTVALMCIGIAFSQKAEAGILKKIVAGYLKKRACNTTAKYDRVLQRRYADHMYFLRSPGEYTFKKMEFVGAGLIGAGATCLGAGYALDAVVPSDSAHKNTAQYVSSGAKKIGANVVYGGAGLTVAGAALGYPKMALLATTVAATFWAALDPDACLKRLKEIRARFTPTESRKK